MKLTIEDLKAMAKCVTSYGYTPPHELTEYCDPYYSPYYSFMYMLSGIMVPVIAVELGVETGRGCKALAMSHRDNRIIGIDHTKRDNIDALLKKHSNFTFINKADMPVPEEVPDNIGILHLDTEHSYAMVWEEFRCYRHKLMDGAVVLFDDVHAQEDGVLKAFNDLPYERFQMDELHPITGFGVMLYNV